MADLIDRQAVLDWLNDEWDGMVLSVFDGIRALSSAETEERTETHACDCISRQAAIDMIEKYFNGLPIAVHYDMIAMIHRLPTAQPESQWTPCSERRPYYSETVIVSILDDTGDCNLNYTDVGWITHDGTWIVDND